MKLLTNPGNPRAFKALIAAQYAGVDLETKTIELGKDDKTAEFRALSPAGKLPVLVCEGKGAIVGSNAIARFVARLRRDADVYGETFFESGVADSWVDFCANDVELPASLLIYPLLGFMEANKAVQAKAAADLKASVGLLEKHLSTRTFMVGKKITLADIALVSALVLPMKLVLDAKWRKAFPCVCRWFTTCVNQPEFLAVLGEVLLCEKSLVPVASAGGAGNAGGKKKKGGKQQKQQPKKKEKKKAAPAPKPKKKAKHPCELLPKSSLVIDSWKRQYSNATPSEYAAMPWFWENLDREGYSLWWSDYQYNEENKKLFMTSNLAGSFVQRCDEIRKYAFGVMQIVGEEGKLMEITGCWLIRGKDISIMLNCNPDAEYHKWTQITDLDDEATRKKVAEYWCAGEDLLGKPILDCKVFK